MNIKQEFKKLTKSKKKNSKKKKGGKPNKWKRLKAKKKLAKHKKKYQDYLKSKEWSDVKLDLYESRGKMCERCGSTNRIEVHHLHYKNVFNEEPEDLVLLCNSCHSEEHGIKKKAPIK